MGGSKWAARPTTISGIATPSGRVTPLVVQAAGPGQLAAACNAATRPKKRATKPPSGTKVPISLSRWLHVGEVQRISTPAIQPSPLATKPKMISHGAQASQRPAPGGGAPASAAMAMGSPTLSSRVRTLAASSVSSPSRPSSMRSCDVGPVPSGLPLLLAENSEAILGSPLEVSPAYSCMGRLGVGVCEERRASPGEPAVPSEERPDVGVLAVAALSPGRAMLLGRELERGRIDRVLEMARRGHSAALVLQGEPGTGKPRFLTTPSSRARTSKSSACWGSNRRPSLASLRCISFCCRFWPDSGLFRHRSGTL